MLLCVIIPALNEEATIGDVIDRILAVTLPSAIDSMQIIVVDDGSSDQTSTIAAEHGAEVASHPENCGVGRAFRTGVSIALERHADSIVNIDADGQFDPDDIPRLLEPILSGDADFVTASRFKDPELVPEMPAIKLWGNKQMSRLISMIVGQRFYDVSCGFRAYTCDTALRLNLWGDFTYTQETFLDLGAKGLRMVEVPCKVRGVREVGESKVARSVLAYARRSSAIMFRAYRDYWPMHFFGGLGLVAFAPGLSLVSFLFYHYFRTRHFSPHLWAGFLGGAFVFLGLICCITGILGAMLRRIRLNQEEVLFLLRQSHYMRPRTDE